MLDDITEKINAILPQTQCGKCDFSGCKPYAKAISEGKADINQCPPGGKNGIVKTKWFKESAIFPTTASTSIGLQSIPKITGAIPATQSFNQSVRAIK